LLDRSSTDPAAWHELWSDGQRAKPHGMRVSAIVHVSDRDGCRARKRGRAARVRGM